MHPLTLQTMRAVGFAIALAIPAAAAAQAADSGRLAVAEQISRTMLRQLDMNKVIGSQMSAGLPPALLAARPEWEPMLRDAFSEQMKRDEPYLARLMAVEIVRDVTSEELAAGQQLLTDPDVLAMFKAVASGEPPAAFRPSRETMRLLSTPAAQSFGRKMQRMADGLQKNSNEIAASLLPGVFQRFADRAEAAETQRRLAAGLPAPLAD